MVNEYISNPEPFAADGAEPPTLSMSKLDALSSILIDCSQK